MTAAGDGYVPLWCKSNFSFLEGASHPEELVETAAELGLPAVAVTDRDGVPGIVRAHVKARDLGVKLIVGSEVTVDDGSTIVLLAQDRGGYANLCRLVTEGRRRCPKGESRVAWREVAEHAGGLFALWGGDRSLLAGEAEPDVVARLLRDAFGPRIAALAARHKRAEEVESEARLRRRARRFGLPVAAAVEVLYHQRARRPLQDVLACTRAGVRLAAAGRATKPNGEHDLKPPAQFAKLFADDPGAVARTLAVAEDCTFRLDDLRYRYPSERLPEGRTTAQWLRELTFSGAAERYPGGVPHDVARQLEKELTLIEDLDYCGYFLTMWEIVQFCRGRAILCQGRGSAANSAVCFCLGITAVDPVRMNLLFERFLSRERAEPPDIDLDVAHERREEVIQHIYAKYGRDRAAMVSNVVRYRPRSAARDVGKALGIAETTLDKLSKLLPHYGELPPETLAAAGIDPEGRAGRLLVELADELLDFPRHLSIHPGGFLLGHEPVSTLVPIENAAMEGRTVVQWDKNDVEDLGLFKVDILALGALTLVDKCLASLKEQRGLDVSMATIPADDPPTFEMVSRGDTVGVFQIESRAQMAMLPRLKPRRFYDLVIEVSIIRPGPISGGMVHPYLRRRNGEEPVEYPHPSLVPVLEKTLGIPLFQEQVMKLAVVAADYTPGEADQLRRDMAAWRRTGRIEAHHLRIVERMTAKGIEPEFAERVFQQIRGFGEYGFPESHAASFALISYATAWLKRHYPAEFACALLDAQPMGFYAPSTIIEDARRHGVEVRPVDVLRSAFDTTLEAAGEGDPPAHSWDAALGPRFALRLGLRLVKGLGAADAAAIARARGDDERDGAAARGDGERDGSAARGDGERDGSAARGDGADGGSALSRDGSAARPFASLDDFVRRTGLDRGALAALAEAGAFDGLGVDRRHALWEIPRLVRARARELPLEDRPEQGRLFAPLDRAEEIAWDYRRTDSSPRGHPMAALRERLRVQRIPAAREVARLPHGERIRYVGVVICRQRPGTAKGVVFLTMEDETGFVNVVLWPKVYERYRVEVKTNPLLGVVGKLETQEGVTHLIADRVFAPKFALGPAPASRDFR